MRNRRLTILLALAISVGCTSYDDEAGEISVDQAADAPEEFDERDVEMVGEVGRIFGDCAFEVTDGAGVFNEPLLVLCAATPPVGQGGSRPPDLREGERVRLTGGVREMTRGNYEYKTTVTLPEEVDFGPRETRATFWAETIEVLPHEDAETP